MFSWILDSPSTCTGDCECLWVFFLSPRLRIHLFWWGLPPLTGTRENWFMSLSISLKWLSQGCKVASFHKPLSGQARLEPVPSANRIGIVCGVTPSVPFYCIENENFSWSPKSERYLKRKNWNAIYGFWVESRWTGYCRTPFLNELGTNLLWKSAWLVWNRLEPGTWNRVRQHYYALTRSNKQMEKMEA